jgi:hypothetical protein
MTPDAGLGPDGAQASWHGFADYLRRTLHAVADQIEPQADGLAPIRARVPGGTGAGERRPARRRRGRRPGVPDRGGKKAP